MSEFDEELFIKYLEGYSFQVVPTSLVSAHLENLKNISNFTDYIRYLFNILFPPMEFMIEKYGLTPNPLKGAKDKTARGKSSPLGVRGPLWFLWYPYRWWVGVKGVIKLIEKK